MRRALPVAQPSPGRVRAHRRAGGILDLPPGRILMRAGATFTQNIQLKLSTVRGDRDRRRRFADARGRHADACGQHLRRLPARDSDPGAEELHRLPGNDHRRHLAPARRQQRTHAVYRPWRGQLVLRRANRGQQRRQLPGRRRAEHQHEQRADFRRQREDCRHPGRRTDGQRAGHQHRDQERWRSVQRRGKPDVSAAGVERRQRS